MIDLIAIKLIEALGGFLFENYINKMAEISLENAPSWYENVVDESKIYVFYAESGGVDIIPKAKNRTRELMIEKIDNIIEIVIYDNFRDIQSGAENRLIQEWKVDNNLPIFVDKSITYDKIEQVGAREEGFFTKKRDAMVFIRAYIPKKVVFEYQKERIINLKNGLLKEKSDSAFDELEDEIKEFE